MANVSRKRAEQEPDYLGSLRRKDQRVRACYLLAEAAAASDSTQVWYLTEAIRESVDSAPSKERDELVLSALRSAGFNA